MSALVFKALARVHHCLRDPQIQLHKENSLALGHLNSVQTGQLKRLFHTFLDLVNRDGAR